MSFTTIAPAEDAVLTNGHAERLNYLNNGHGLRSWLLTKDHKRIAILYLLSVSFFFVIGGIFALLIRLNLLTPNGMFDPDTYNRIFTAHGIIMVFLFLVPAVPAILGNFLLPIMIGAKDLAFPKINLLSWYCYIVGAGFALVGLIAGGVDTGRTFYYPFTTSCSNSH